MYLPPPGKIAIIGAGPIGLEAALYARYLGYAVDIYERGRVAENVREWTSEKMATPFVLNASPLGLAALAAQDESFRPPQADEILTGQEWIERYLGPLAQSDLIVDGLHEQTTVVGIERLAPSVPSPAEDVDDDAPPPASFRLRLRTAAGDAATGDANAVIDASGAGEGGAIDGLPAPNVYAIGANAGEEPATFVQGLGQIRALFAQIADRAELDLYTSIRPPVGD